MIYAERPKEASQLVDGVQRGHAEAYLCHGVSFN